MNKMRSLNWQFNNRFEYFILAVTTTIARLILVVYLQTGLYNSFTVQ